jgi:hypothetical protein
LDCQDEFFVNNLLDVEGNDEHALDFSLLLANLFSVSGTLDFPCTAYTFFSERLSDVALSDPLRNHMSPDTRLQIKGRKSWHFHQLRVNFVH